MPDECLSAESKSPSKTPDKNPVRWFEIGFLSVQKIRIDEGESGSEAEQETSGSDKGEKKYQNYPVKGAHFYMFIF